MPSPRKYFINNTAIFVSTRTEEGLPLVPTNFMNALIWSVLVRAQSAYPRVKVCSFLFMPNHFHMLLVVDDPEQVSRFVGYVKQEISHFVNRLLGRRQKTLWKAEYDSPVVLDAEKVKDILRYIYTNPVAAGSESSIDKYPGISSWEMLVTKARASWHPAYSRDATPRLSNPIHPDREDEKICKLLNDSSKKTLLFTFEPFAWKNCFESTKDTSDEELLFELVEMIREKEGEYADERRKNNTRVAGSQSLISSSMLREYTPKKFGRRMICLAKDRKLRVQFITFFKKICEKARDVFSRWKRNDFSEEYPPGLFQPPYPRIVNILCEYALCPSR